MSFIIFEIRGWSEIYGTRQSAIFWKELSEQRIIRNSNNYYRRSNIKFSKQYLQVVYSNSHSVYKKFPFFNDNLFSFPRKTELYKGWSDRMTDRSWSFGDSGLAFDGLNGKENFFNRNGSWQRVMFQMGQHCWKSLLYCPLEYNHDANGVFFDVFRYGCSYRTKRSKKCMSFPTEIKSLHCYAIESGIQEIYLFIGLLRQVANRTICGLNWNFSQFVREHPFCIAMEDPKHFVCNCVLNTRNVAWRNPEASLPWNSHICFAILFREQNVPLPCC